MVRRTLILLLIYPTCPCFHGNSWVGGVIILTTSITIMCMIVRFHKRKRQSVNSVSSVTAQPQNQGIYIPIKIWFHGSIPIIYVDAALATLQPSKCQNNPAYIHSSQTALVSDNYGKNPAYNSQTLTMSQLMKLFPQIRMGPPTLHVHRLQIASKILRMFILVCT